MKKYTVENLERTIESPGILLGELKRKVNKLNRAYHRVAIPNRGVYVMEEDWDNLIILDGCRYDLFDDVHRFDGDLQKVVSRGSNSEEFIEENFSDRTFHDTVYVSANPFTKLLLEDGVFHDVINVFDLAWDTDLRTVKPESMVDHTVSAFDRYPHKRIICHFMQPHYPFIGELGRSIAHKGLSGEVAGSGDGSPTSELPIWTKFRYGITEASIEDVWAAYSENLQLVLPYVEELIDTLDGKSVITADHGNLFGENIRPIPVRTYGHPPGFRAPALVDVPWFVPPFEGRRSIYAETPRHTPTSSYDASETERRLADLGYV